MKLDLVLCLATAAYAAPLPRIVNKNVQATEAIRVATAAARKTAEELSNILAEELKEKNFRDKLTNMLQTLKTNNEAARLAKIKTLVENGIEKQSKKVADLTADVKVLDSFINERMGRVPMNLFYKWQTIWNLGDKPNFPKLLELAEGKLALAEKAMQRQETIRREVQRNLVGQ